MANLRGLQNILSIRTMLSLTKLRHFGKCMFTQYKQDQHCLSYLHQQITYQQVCKFHQRQENEATVLKMKGILQTADLIRLERQHSSTPGLVVHQRKRTDKTQHFSEIENDYFHSYLESSSEYHPYLLTFVPQREPLTLPREKVVKLLWEVKEKWSTEHLFTLLEHWSCAANVDSSSVLSDKHFGQTVQLLAENITALSVEEILQSMACLYRVGFRDNAFTTQPRQNRIRVSKVFDFACTRLIKRMQIRELFLAADFFYGVRGSAFTQFLYKMCEEIKSSLASLTKPELVVLLFHVSLARRCPDSLIDLVLNNLKEHMNSLTLQELGIVNLAHFKTETLVKQPEYFIAVQKQFENQNSFDVDSVCLSALLKYQKRSINKCKDEIFPQFFTVVKNMEHPFLQRIPSLPSDTVMHIFYLYYSMDMLSEDLFMSVTDKIRHRGIQNWRLKDIAKVTHVLGNTPLGSESRLEAFEVILAELQKKERRKETCDYPACLLQIATSLSYSNIYPYWLAEELFDLFAKRIFKDNARIMYLHDFYHLSESITIEDATNSGRLLQTYKFPKLAKNKVYSKLANMTKDEMAYHTSKAVNGSGVYEKRIFNRDRILLDLMDILSQVYPQASLIPSYLLSHFNTADIEIQHFTDDIEQGEKAPSKRSFGKRNRNRIREAVVLHGNNAFLRVRLRDGRTVPLLCQYHAMRVRQLRKLGAVIVEIPYFEFEASSDKHQYLLTKLSKEKESQ